MMRVYMTADPAMDNKLDFAGMNAAYARFFGTPEQPNKPARSTVQVAALVAAGALLEIEVQAARGKGGESDAPQDRASVRDDGDHWRGGGVERGRARAAAGSRRGSLYRPAGERREGRLREELRLLPHA